MKKVLIYGVEKNVLDALIPVFDEEAILHFIKNFELEELLLDVLEKEADSEYEEADYKMTICIFAGHSREEVFATIDRIKLQNIKRPVFAMVTKNNINWKIGRILVDANQDHIEMNKGNYGKN